MKGVGDIVNKNMCYILGTVFLITSSLLYTLQRAISVMVWKGEVDARINGIVPLHPPGAFEPFTNVFVPAFLLIGIILFAYGKKLKV